MGRTKKSCDNKSYCKRYREKDATGLPRLRIKILGQILGGIWPNFRRNLGEFSIFKEDFRKVEGEKIVFI